MISIEQIISEKLRAKEEEKKREQNSWYASSLGSCLRGQYFARIGAKPDKEITDRELRVFDVGNQMEKWLIDLVSAKDGIKVETQQRLYSEKWGISGRPSMPGACSPRRVPGTSPNSCRLWETRDRASAMKIQRPRIASVRALNPCLAGSNLSS